MNFSDFGFHPALMSGLDAMNFKTATPVQEKAIPAILKGQDILAVAQTGTGKTAAFLLPILNAMTVDPPDGIDTMIIEPTRELVMQVDQQLEGFSYFTPVSSIAVYGGRDGQSMELERKALKQGAPIIVATPGRLIAHIDLGYVDLSKIRHLVLDEADRMLDMGFAQDIMKIVNQMPLNRQTLLFSATMPPKIREFARQLLRNPLEINIAVSKPAQNIMQVAYEVEDEAKIRLAERLLTEKKRIERVLIFAGTKRKVRDLAETLKRRGINVGDIHSDLLQEEREIRLAAFKSGSLPVVVATDVLSRGIDIRGIDVVINFDVPGDAEDYVHRIGRTARADASGVAITFINRKDRGRFKRIEELIGNAVRRLPLPDGLPTPAKHPAQKHRRPSKGSAQPASLPATASPATHEAGDGGDDKPRKRRKRGGRRRGGKKPSGPSQDNDAS